MLMLFFETSAQIRGTLGGLGVAWDADTGKVMTRRFVTERRGCWCVVHLLKLAFGLLILVVICCTCLHQELPQNTMPSSAELQYIDDF